jgi:hypothetical protein
VPCATTPTVVHARGAPPCTRSRARRSHHRHGRRRWIASFRSPQARSHLRSVLHDKAVRFHLTYATRIALSAWLQASSSLTWALTCWRAWQSFPLRPLTMGSRYLCEGAAVRGHEGDRTSRSESRQRVIRRPPSRQAARRRSRRRS